MAASSPFDLMQLDSLFPKESLQLRDQTREMINKDFLPQINENFENEVFPTKAVKSFAEAKLFGPTIQGYGCLGTDHNTYGLLMQEIERCDSGLRSFASVQGALCMYPIYKFGKKPIKDKYLEAMAKGDVIGCFGLTEPEHGSNPSGMTTTATKRGDTWILNGHKRWLTNGLISDLAVIWAKNDDGKVNGFVIPSKTRGMNLKAIPHRWSLRASVSAELELVDVEVDESHRLDIEGLKGPFSCLNLARFGIGWGALGAAQACFEETLCYTKQRSQFANKPLAGHQLIQAKLVEIFTDITTGQLLSFRIYICTYSDA